MPIYNIGMQRQDTRTLSELWEEVLYSTKFQPSFFLHLTYRDDCRPVAGSDSHYRDVEGLMRSIAMQIQEHVLCYGGFGSNGHCHLIVCTMGGKSGYRADKVACDRISRLWNKGLVKCDIYDPKIGRGALYALNKHEILDGMFNKVFCPRVKKSCKQHPKGCVFAWKKDYLRKRTQQ